MNFSLQQRHSHEEEMQNYDISFSPLDKAVLFNHIKKLHLCTDLKLIRSISRLQELKQDLKISSNELQLSRDELISFCDSDKINFCCFADADYPSAFYHLKNPPAIFYYTGELDLINQNYNLAIVGTRNSSLYGEHSCRSIVEALENYDVTFVSGLARGIDLMTHKTALRTKAPSIAVLGEGLLSFKAYGERTLYFEELKKHHLVISELHPQDHASKRSFVLRNRLIAALSNSTVVIEAPHGSGALVTAKHCLALERALFALPGDLNKKSFEGSNKLLSENKAQPIFQASKIAYVLGLANYDLEHKTPMQNKALNESKDETKQISRIKNKIQKQILNYQSQKDSSFRDQEKNSNKKLDLLKDPLIDLLDSGINDFDLLLFKSQYSSHTELIKHLTELEIQGRLSRKGALFVTS